jgi:hypothetical protein
MSDPEREFQRARELRAAGRFEEALAVFDGLVRSLPEAAGARAPRGLTLCNLRRFDEGIADLRAAIAAAPRNAGFHADLGAMLFVHGDAAAAEVEVRRALALSPGMPDGLNTLSMILRARGDFAGAESAARQALARNADHYPSAMSLALALLPQGRFAEAWPHYAKRPDSRINPRDFGAQGIVPHVDRLPPAPAPIVLHGEQGLGDTLFFLRFAPLLRARGHRLAFWGDPRLRPLLEPTGLFEHFLGAQAVPAEGLAVAWLGDLPGMVGANDPASFPPPLALAADGARREAVRAALARFGPAPYVAITWRAGLAPEGRLTLAKSIAPALLGRSLAGLRATFVSVQRDPAPGELAALGEALGAPLHDAGPWNDRLEDMLAAMEAVDEYVGVSNTNTHLRAASARGARVLVPWPPEWRWMREGERSPWFPRMETYRQAADGSWDAALARMRAALERDAGGALP